MEENAYAQSDHIRTKEWYSQIRLSQGWDEQVKHIEPAVRFTGPPASSSHRHCERQTQLITGRVVPR